MYIRKAEKKDIPQIETLLYQVAKVREKNIRLCILHISGKSFKFVNPYKNIIHR